MRVAQGWEIFQAFEEHCRLPGGGFASIYDVDQVPVVHEDRMETFWIAETVRSFSLPLVAKLVLTKGSTQLKYLYLLFSEESLIPLSEYVFNTEVHPSLLRSLPR